MNILTAALIPQIVDNPVGEAAHTSVTIELVIICFAVASVAVGITTWAIGKFQTKSEALKSEAHLLELVVAAEDRMRGEVAAVKDELKGLHQHLNKVREELKHENKTVWDQITAVRTENSLMAKDLAYIRGRLEPKP